MKTDDGEEKTTSSESDKDESSNEKEKKKLPDSWQSDLFDAIDEHLKKHPGLFDPKDITDDEKFQDFRITLEEFLGIDTDDLSDKEIERMKERVADHYRTEAPSGWETELFDAIDEHLKRNPGLFDPKDITDDEKFQDFKLTLGEFAGIDASNYSDEEIERMKERVADHYRTEPPEGWEEGFFDAIDEHLKRNPGLFDPKDITDEDKFQDFKLTLGEFAGIDTSNYSDKEINKMKKMVEEHYGKSSKSLTSDQIDKIARDVIRGKYGNGQERRKNLGDNYQAIQQRVNEMSSGKSSSASKKDIDTMAKDVISGKYGNGQERKAALGDDYKAVQSRVNEMLSGSKGETKVSEVKVSSKVKDLLSNVISKLSNVKVSSNSNSTTSKPDLDEVYNVYKKKK